MYAWCVFSRQHKLFYASEPVDKLPKVVSFWKPGVFPRRFMCDIVELCHVQLALLEENARFAAQEERQAMVRASGEDGNDDNDDAESKVRGGWLPDVLRAWLTFLSDVTPRRGAEGGLEEPDAGEHAGGYGGVRLRTLPRWPLHQPGETTSDARREL
jgi:hypothetical protein